MSHRKVRNYEQQVYAGVLGKIIGVYMGRPFEGWPKAKIEERFGRIDRYVHEDLGKPLVVADDDISGTFTFVRALEDSGLYADTPDECFGDTWLNYVLENRTIFWWGGVGMSTEHTAFVRLVEGVRSPRSGSIETNGRTVAEQIGAQIFIDAFGMVSPGDPALAASLARRAGAVSHDGEAVHAAAVTAATTPAAGAWGTRPGLVDGELPPAEVRLVHFFDGLLAFLFVFHLDEAEAPRTPGLTVGDDRRPVDLPELREQILELRVGGGEGEVAHIDVDHDRPQCCCVPECVISPAEPSGYCRAGGVRRCGGWVGFSRGVPR